MPDASSKPSPTKPLATKTVATKPALTATDKALASKPLDYWRSAQAPRRSGIRRWLGGLGTTGPLLGRKLLDGLKTLSWLAPLTLLIWIYAEREQIATRSTFILPIDVPKRIGNHVYTLLEPTDRNLALEVTGPQVGLDRLENEWHGSGADHAPFSLSIPQSLSAGTKATIPVLPQLAESRVFKSRGLSVKNSVPINVTVLVDDLVKRTLPIKAPAGLSLAGEPQFTPPAIEVTAPSQVFAAAERAGAMYLTADIKKRVDEIKTPGPISLPAIALAWPFSGDPNVSFGDPPPQIQATVEVRQMDERFKLLRPVPVWPSAPASLLKDYKVICPTERITNVEVIGPPDKIELLKTDQYPVKAVLEIRSEDKDVPDPHHKVRYDLPEGVNVVGDKANEDLSFTVIPLRGPEGDH